MSANVELLNRVMDRIENAPEGEWDQSNWCKCFAGQTAQELGYVTTWSYAEGAWLTAVGIDANGRSTPVLEIAKGELGLSIDERYALFDGTNTKEHLRAVVSGITQRVLAEEMEVADEAPMVIDKVLETV